jgi:NAD-dependent histone deacetylase SIR2
MPGGDLDGGCEVVQLHGDLHVLRCTLCQQTCQWKDKDEARLVAGEAPICHFCTILNEDRQDRGKRGIKVGTLRPNIVLYGEEHPAADAVGTITAHDLALSPDVLLVLGTSLHVHGLKILVKEFAKAVHARANGKGKVVFVNISKPSDSIWKDVFDYWVSMDCDEWVSALRVHRPDIWQIQRELRPSVSKGLGKLSSKAVPSSCLKSKAYEDKENVSLATQGNKISPPLVVLTPRKKRPLQERASSFIEQCNQAASVKPGNSTSVPCSSQLPTPPSSGRKGRLQVPSAKRSRDEEDVNLVATPSKKRKAMLSIWEDPDTGDRRRQVHRV